MDFVIKGIIDRVENKKAVIRLEDKQEILWPLTHLPQGIQEGESVNLRLSTDITDQKEREKKAKDLLNEILKKND